MKPDVAELMRTHQADVWRYLRYLGCEESEADDLTQETFLATMRGAFEERSRAETAAYLRTVARHLFLNELRRQRRELPFGPEAEAETAWERFTPEGDSSARVEALRECLERLDGRARDAVDRRYRRGQNGPEIADALGMSDQAVRSLLWRARQMLRDCVERKVRG